MKITLNMKKELIIALEVTDTHIKLLQGKGAAADKIITAGEIHAVHTPSDDELIKTLSDIVTAKRFRAPTVVIIPRRFTILKQMSLPSTEETEIRKIIDLQIINKVPYSREDIIYDYLLLEKDPSGYSKVLVVIVHRDVIQRYLKIANKARLQVSRFTLSSIGLLHWFSYQVTKGRLQLLQPTVLINIDETDAEICFCQNDKLLFSRGIPFGAKDLTDQHLPDFLEQVALTLKSYQKDNMGPDVASFVLISTIPQVNLLKEKLKEEYQIPIEILTPIDNLSCPKDLNLSSIWGQSGVSLAVSLGTLLAPDTKLLNLLPVDVRHSGALKFKRQQGVKTILLICITLLMGLFAVNSEFYRYRHQLTDLQGKIVQFKPQIEEAKKINQLVSFVRKNIYGRIPIADVIAELYRLTPDDIAFSALSINDQGIITIQGFSQSPGSVNTFQSQLVNSSMLKEVTLQYASRSRVFNEALTDFKITCQLNRKK